MIIARLLVTFFSDPKQIRTYNLINYSHVFAYQENN